jgi:hypothetical protein
LRTQGGNPTPYLRRKIETETAGETETETRAESAQRNPDAARFLSRVARV